MHAVAAPIQSESASIATAGTSSITHEYMGFLVCWYGPPVVSCVTGRKLGPCAGSCAFMAASPSFTTLIMKAKTATKMVSLAVKDEKRFRMKR